MKHIEKTMKVPVDQRSRLRGVDKRALRQIIRQQRKITEQADEDF